MGYKIKDPSPKQPGMIDERALLSGKERFLIFVEQNRRLILGGLALGIVAIVGIAALLWMENQRSEQALALEGKAQSLYLDRAVDNPEKAKKSLGEAIELYQRIIEEFPRTPSARHALYLKGNALMERGDLEEAINTYKQFIQDYGRDPLLLSLVYQRLGYAQLLQGNDGQAMEAFSNALAIPDALNKDQILFELAKLHEARGKTEQALSSYKQLMEQYPASPYTQEASLRVKILSPEESSQMKETTDGKTPPEEGTGTSEQSAEPDTP